MSTTSTLDMEAQKATASRRINASPETIFDLLADPSKHALFDGSDMVQSGTSERLRLGSKFGMNMKFKFLPYKIGNTVVEFEENQRIAWAHMGKHRWRYELEAMDDGSTLVTETFDWSTAIAPPAIVAAGYPKRNLEAIEKTLERLAEHVEQESIEHGA